jgi:hypothetical protein
MKLGFNAMTALTVEELDALERAVAIDGGKTWPEWQRLIDFARAHLTSQDAINILFDGPPSPEGGRLVEVETDDGKSIKAGEWIERPDGLWALRILTSQAWREEVLEEAEKAAIDVGNFGDLTREELTEDFGKPRFDMMQKIVAAIRALKGSPTTNTNGERDDLRDASNLSSNASPKGALSNVQPNVGQEGDRAAESNLHPTRQAHRVSRAAGVEVAAPAITEGWNHQCPDFGETAPLPEPIAAGEDVVVPFTGITKLDLPAERIISGAAEANLGTVVIIGFDGEGDFFFSSNKADGGEVLWLMELARKKLMEIGDQ